MYIWWFIHFTSFVRIFNVFFHYLHTAHYLCVSQNTTNRNHYRFIILYTVCLCLSLSLCLPSYTHTRGGRILSEMCCLQLRALSSSICFPLSQTSCWFFLSAFFSLDLSHSPSLPTTDLLLSSPYPLGRLLNGPAACPAKHRTSVIASWVMTDKGGVLENKGFWTQSFPSWKEK